MDDSQTQSELVKEKISHDFSRNEQLGFGQGLFTRGGGSVFPRHRLVILSLGLLNAALLVTAVVIGIYCAKAQDLEVSNSAATPLIIEMKYLRNQSHIIRAKVEALTELSQERESHMKVKVQVKEQKTITDKLQGQIQTLDTMRTNLRSNKSTLVESCGRCPLGWILRESSCYYFSSLHVSNSKKNWPGSRADCMGKGGDLLVINNLVEQQLISDNFPRQSSSVPWWERGFWIGLTDVVTEGTWVWVNNVTEAETMYWKTGQPDREGHQSLNCAAFDYYSDSTKTWYNGNCHTHLRNWICEMEPS